MPKDWEVFEFSTPFDVSAMALSNLLDGQSTVEILFPHAAEHDEQGKLVATLMQKTVNALGSDSSTNVELISDKTAINHAVDSVFGAEETLAMNSNVDDAEETELAEIASTARDPSDQIQEVLGVMQQDLEVLENKMEEVALQQSDGNPVPLLEFGSLAQKITQKAEQKFKRMEEKGQIPPSLSKGLKKGITKQIQRLYKDQLQSLRNYYGQRYESILADDSIGEAEKERQVATAAQHITQGFQAAARSAIPEVYRDDSDSEFEHTDVLNGLLNDMLEATERQKDEESLNTMVKGDDEEEPENASGKAKRRKIKVPRWLERIAARAFV
ncbi:MAG: hypothetical protein SGARI_003946, partial [Bacillariaceae sp.]